ncbi:acyltransferase family protein [Streptomyces sp. NPDC058985]|uniref:acyltransferase family protein n=1 Tax=Streptomyces sp. NPDC058985 TaxID=3346684 RepID=UPI00368B4C9E
MTYGSAKNAPRGGATPRAYLPAMDGLRGLAAVMVVTIHLAGWTGVAFDPQGKGLLATLVNRFGVSVYIFFVISGYLLFRPFAAAALEGREAPGLKAYYWHRFLRIYPAFWALLLLSVLFFHRSLTEEPARLLRVLALQHTFVAGDFPHTPEWPWSTFSQTWSLSTEISFYLVLPLLAALFRGLLGGGRGLGPALAGCALLEAVNVAWWIGIWSSADTAVDPTRWWWLPGYIGFFAAGMALATVSVYVRRQADGPPALVRFVVRRPWLCWAAALAAYVVISTPLAGGHMEPPSPRTALVEHFGYLVVSVGLALPLALAPGSGPERLLSTRGMTWLGRISYGIFLWHMFVMAAALRLGGWDWGEPGMKGFLLLLPVTAAGTVLLGWLSYVLVERPLRRRFRRRVRPSDSAGHVTAERASDDRRARNAGM